MIDLMLRFTDETEAARALAAYRQEDRWIAASHDHALDVIGPVAIVPPVINPATGEVITPAVMDNRFHVNLRLMDGPAPTELETYTVNPPEPARVWAGGNDGQ